MERSGLGLLDPERQAVVADLRHLAAAARPTPTSPRSPTRATGVAVYDSYAYQGSSGWLVFGGTSASSPIVGSVYALSGNTTGYPASYTWAHASSLNDVTSGSNGTCPTTRWCTAGSGWDGPTGLGTPIGIAAF